MESELTEKQAKAKVSRAALRAYKRGGYPESGKRIVTPTGPTGSRNVFEKNVQGRRVALVTTEDKDYPGSKGEPASYVDIAAAITSRAALTVLEERDTSDTDEEDLGVDDRRAAATLISLTKVSEDQRNRGRKHLRGAIRAIGSEILPAKDVLGTKTPGFPQARRKDKRVKGDIGGMEYHRRVWRSDEPMTLQQRAVIGQMSTSSSDSEINKMSDDTAIRKYRLKTEDKQHREEMDEDVASDASPSATKRPKAGMVPKSSPVGPPPTRRGKQRGRSPTSPSRRSPRFSAPTVDEGRTAVEGSSPRRSPRRHAGSRAVVTKKIITKGPGLRKVRERESHKDSPY